MGAAPFATESTSFEVMGFEPTASTLRTYLGRLPSDQAARQSARTKCAKRQGGNPREPVEPVRRT
jgi:hypothetical protein